jgi:uncharacterized protein (DUF885 family)
MRFLALSCLISVASCATTTQPTPTPATAVETSTVSETKSKWPPADSAVGVDNEQLRDLLTKHWMNAMENAPMWATELGIRRFDDRVGDNSFGAIQKRRQELKNFAQEFATVTISELKSNDRVTLTLIREFMNNEIAAEVCRFEEWSINPRSNPITHWNYLPTLHKVESYPDGQNLLSRYAAIAASIDSDIDNLRRGIASKLFANAESTRRVIAMLDNQLKQELKEWPLMAPALKEHKTWEPDQTKSYRKQLATLLTGQVRPALTRYRDFLKQEILPHARPNDTPGLASLPLGEACYSARVTNFTNLQKTAAEIHEIGQKEIKRINDRMRELGEKLFRTKDLSTILKKLRTDPELYFDTEEEVENKAKTALKSAREKMPEYFGILPKADCVVTRVPDYEAPYTTIAYYRPPFPDGSKPGEYFINVYEPKTRPRYEAEALAFHEAIPGHHLQIAISQELPALPAFRKHLGMTAFVEGWALYTESLSDEMGLYSGDLDRMGMLSYEAWRASRLVVDTGLHKMGWSREKAVKFMLEHTALAENNIRNEVDRYITWPGQALGYKIGQLEIFRLRKWAKDELKDSFDIKKFHDTVIGAGAVTMSIVEDRVKAWIDSEKNKK